MKYWLTPLLGASFVGLAIPLSSPSIAQTNDELVLVYPPRQHETTAEQIFLIGTSSDTVYVNGNPIEQTQAGHFAPSFPLEMGKNQFTLRDGNQTIAVEVTRVSPLPEPPPEGGLAPETLTPSQPIARSRNESICLSAVGTGNAEVYATLNNQVIPLSPQTKPSLPPNYAVLTGNNEPLPSPTQLYEGCFIPKVAGNLGSPSYTMKLGDRVITGESRGEITILSPENLQVIEVTSENGAARTGPGTSYSRLTPLPQGTMATVNGREGEWLRLSYGAWINAKETRIKPNAVSPHTLIRSIQGQTKEGMTEIVFPLQIPVPVSVKQEDDRFRLTLHHTTAQTDTIRLDDDPLVRRLDWEQVAPNTVQYTFHLKSEQQWGYQLRYEGTRLILALKHPPNPSTSSVQPLEGMSILLDPGHGGEELGARGPTGYPEKTVNLIVSQLLREELERRGATVDLTRETDQFVSLRERMTMIDQLQPTIALSIHYNALPDDGDAINTKGIGVFWYNPPAHDLSVFLHNYLVTKLDRPSYGVFWNTLALTRPHTTLAVLLELGFMINPTEFEWITDSQAQSQLAGAIAQGIELWWKQQKIRVNP